MNTTKSRRPRRPRRSQESGEPNKAVTSKQAILLLQFGRTVEEIARMTCAEARGELSRKFNEIKEGRRDHTRLAVRTESSPERTRRPRRDRRSSDASDVAAPKDPNRPASEKQIEFLIGLGADAGALTALTVREASSEIQRRLREREAADDPGPHSPMLASVPTTNPWKRCEIVEREDGSVKLRFLGDRPQRI